MWRTYDADRKAGTDPLILARWTLALRAFLTLPTGSWRYCFFSSSRLGIWSTRKDTDGQPRSGMGDMDTAWRWAITKCLWQNTGSFYNALIVQ